MKPPPTITPKPDPPSPSFEELLSEIYRSEYTGRLIIHCQSGLPRLAEWAGRREPIR